MDNIKYVHLLYTHLPYHNDSIIKQTHEVIKMQEGTTQEDFFTNIFTSHFIARVRKGCSMFACERVLETEHKLHILTSLLWPSRCVFLVLLMLGLLHRGFPRAPSVGRGLPYHIWSLAVWNSTGNCFGTQLNSIYNNSTLTRSPTGSLKSNV